MSLDIRLTIVKETMVFDTNITHNLGTMATAAGMHKHLWRPEELGIKLAGELITPLEEGLAKLKANPKEFEVHNAPNGWGTYKHFVPFVEEYLEACKKYPDAVIHVDR